MTNQKRKGTKMSSSTSTQPNGETTALAPTLASVSEQVSAKASQLKNSVTDLGRKAAATIDDNLDVVADSLDSAAYAVYENAANLPGGKTSSRIANAAANRMGATAG